ncbi:hypothetical protein Tco_0517854 [Tanacetum coccineum]
MISNRDVYREGFDQNTTLDVVLSNGHLNWPNEWYDKYPLLNSIANPIITPGNDKLEWHDFDGLVKPFFVHTVWNTIRPRSAMVWLKVKRFAGLPSSNPSIDSIIQDIIPFAKRKTSRSIIAKLVVAATSYFIWKERNNRMFKKSKRSNGQVVDCIINLVRLKLLSCKWKKSKAIFDIVNLWNLDEFEASQSPEQVPPSPDYVPGPEYPDYVALSDDEIPEDPEEDLEEDLADYPTDGGDEEEQEEEASEEDEAEDEEHLAPTNSVVLPAIDHIPSAEET